MRSKEHTSCAKSLLSVQVRKKFVQSLISSSFIMECFYFGLKLLKTKTKFSSIYLFSCCCIHLSRATLAPEGGGFCFSGKGWHELSPSQVHQQEKADFHRGGFLPSRCYNVYEYGFFSSVSSWGHYVSLACCQSLHVCMCCVLHTWILALCLLLILETVFP